MAPWLADIFHHQFGLLDVEVWLEPFAGGAGAALTALEHHGVPEAWLVERNPAVAAFWRCLRTDGVALADRVQGTVPSLADFWASRDLVTAALDGHTIPDDTLAFAAFLVNRCSRSGMVLPNVGPIGGKRQDGEWSIASRFNGPALAQRIRQIAALDGRLSVYEGDAVDYVRDLTGSGVEEEAFLFVDPPYLGVGNDLYAQGMTGAEHSALAEALLACPSRWVLTYDAHPDVLGLYPGCTVVEFEIPHTANRQRIDTEYVVLSPNLTMPPVDAHPLGKGSWRLAATG